MLPLAPAVSRSQDKAERGKQRLMQTLQALGGSRFSAMEDRVESGRVYSFYNAQLSGLARATIYTRYLTPPRPLKPGGMFVRERQAFGKDQDYAVLFGEDKGWQITWRGARPMPQATFDRYLDSTRRNVFYILRQRLDEPGLLIEFRGSEILDNQPVDVVDITDSDNITLSVYVHQSTHLPLRQLFFRRDPATRERNEEMTVFAKYRDVGGGVQWPWTITRLRNGEKIYEIFSDSVGINQNLNDLLFTLPANMKILPPPK
jgi:hypothetical protein